jgi:hypothetical protein
VGEEVNLIRKLKYPWILTKEEIIGNGVLANIMKYPKKGRNINRRNVPELKGTCSYTQKEYSSKVKFS